MNARTGSRRLQSRAFDVFAVVILGVLLLSPVLGISAPAALALGSRNAPPAQGAEPGPRVWIEFPPDGQVLPSVPVEIYVITNDPQGVDLVSLRINGQPLPDAHVKSQDAGMFGGCTLLRQEWMPPGDGEYILEARGRSPAGTYGEPRYVKFCIGSCKAAKATPSTEPRAEALVIPTAAREPDSTDEPIITPSSKYDLTVGGMERNPEDIVAGEPNEFTITIISLTAPLGEPYFPASHFRWRQDTGLPWKEESCPANTQSRTCVKKVTLLYDKPGSASIEIEVDSRQAISEENENNNKTDWWVPISGVHPSPPSFYDLYVDRIEFSNGELTVVIATDGSPVGSPLFPGCSFQYREGPDDYWDYGDCSRKYDFAFCRATVPHSLKQPGTYVVEVVADCDEEVAESDETNNYGRQTIVIEPVSGPSPTPPLPLLPGYDLYVRRMDFMQANPVVGDPIDLSVMLATDFAPQGAAYYPASHFRWRQGANFPWQEEVCPDNFQYASCVKDVTFSYAQPGSYVVEVQADSRGTIPETDETNNAKTWTINVGQPAQQLPPQPPAAEAEIYFWADPSAIYAGQCATLYWEVSGVQAVYLDGQGVTGSENRNVCPGETTAYTLHVVKEGGATEDRQAVVTVEGMIESPEYPPEPPPDEGIGSPELPPEAPSAQDTTGPNISGVGVNWQDCNAYGYATIVDDSGVGWAHFYFNLDGTGWRSLWMSDRGGGYWEADYPVQASGTNGYIEYYVATGDNLGNESESGAESGTYECYGSEIPQTLNF